MPLPGGAAAEATKRASWNPFGTDVWMTAQTDGMNISPTFSNNATRPPSLQEAAHFNCRGLKKNRAPGEDDLPARGCWSCSLGVEDRRWLGVFDSKHHRRILLPRVSCAEFSRRCELDHATLESVATPTKMAKPCSPPRGRLSDCGETSYCSGKETRWKGDILDCVLSVRRWNRDWMATIRLALDCRWTVSAGLFSCL